MMKIASQKGVH